MSVSVLYTHIGCQKYFSEMKTINFAFASKTGTSLTFRRDKTQQIIQKVRSINVGTIKS